MMAVPKSTGRRTWSVACRTTPSTSSPLARKAHALYEPILERALRRRGAVIASTFVLIGLGAWLASTLGAEFIPTLDEGAVAMQAVRPPSVSLEESVEATTRIEQALVRAFPDEIDTIVSRTGRPEIATDPMGVEISDIYIMLNPVDAWKRATSKAELVEAFEHTLEREVAGQNYSFSQPIELRTNELISGVRSDVAINLYGPDFEELERSGARIMEVLGTVPGATGISADQVAGLPSLRIIVERDAAARHGLDVADVLSAVDVIGGKQVGVVFEEQKRFALQVRLDPQARQNAHALSQLLIATPDGARVPLGEVAQIKLDEGPLVVSRESTQRRRTIQVNVRGRDLAGFVREARQRIHDEAALPPGYFLSWGGQFENLQAASSRLAIALPAALLLIFLLLYTTFGQVRPASIIYPDGGGGRSGGAVGQGDALLDLGGGGLYRALGDRCAQWRGDGDLHPRAARRGGRA